MNRIGILRAYIDDILLHMEDSDERRSAYIHLYGVAQLSGLLALKRGGNPETAIMAGMLHDIWSYARMDTTDHATKSAVMAKKILDSLKVTTSEETISICNAIAAHSDKDAELSGLDDILVDADVFQHYLYDPSITLTDPARQQRCEKVKRELGIQQTN